MKNKNKLFKYIGIAMICIAIIVTGYVAIAKNSNYMNNAVLTASIKLNKTSVSISKGQKVTLKVTVTPSNKKVTWSTSNKNVVTVSNDGKLTWVGSGTATITAKTNDAKATCVVTALDYMITKDSKLDKYPTVASYNSDTLKYRIVKRSSKDDNNKYSLIWVKDANKQLNSAMPKLGKVYKPEDILSKEVSKKGYEKKGLIATNASFFWDGWGDSPCIPFVMNKGKIVRDIQNIDYKKPVYTAMGITKDGILKTYKLYKNNYKNNQKAKQKMLDDGIRNTFAINKKIIDTDGNMISSTEVKNRTILCQIDKNNFVIATSTTISFVQIAKDLKNSFGCRVAYNLDGGGSQALFYKKASMSKAKAITIGRNLPDMMYFVEQ